MADNKEIIFILTRTNSIKDGIRTETHKDNAITRQEAIEIMAKAICREDNCLDSCAECILGFGSSAEEKEQFCQKQIIMSRDLSASYVSRAEAALDALLGVEK